MEVSDEAIWREASSRGNRGICLAKGIVRQRRICLWHDFSAYGGSQWQSKTAILAI